MSSELFDILNNQENKELFKVRGREITKYEVVDNLYDDECAVIVFYETSKGPIHEIYYFRYYNYRKAYGMYKRRLFSNGNYKPLSRALRKRVANFFRVLGYNFIGY